MNWYSVIPRDNVPGAFLDIDGVDFCGCNVNRLYQGTAIEDWPEDVTFSASEHEPGERADDALATFNLVPVFSNRLQTVVVEAGIKDFQFLPCRVVNALGVEIKGYAVANVLTIRSAFAPDHGRVLYVDPQLNIPFVSGNIKTIVEPALFESRLSDCDAMRIPEFCYRLFVSKRFVRAYRKIKATGFSFQPAVLINQRRSSTPR